MAPKVSNQRAKIPYETIISDTVHDNQQTSVQNIRNERWKRQRIEIISRGIAQNIELNSILARHYTRLDRPENCVIKPNQTYPKPLPLTRLCSHARWIDLLPCPSSCKSQPSPRLGSISHARFPLAVPALALTSAAKSSSSIERVRPHPRPTPSSCAVARANSSSSSSTRSRPLTVPPLPELDEHLGGALW
ncbi:hypothetical protein M5K25_017884 [Dendrobium thyrsiflorum]|uniref:Uncharacterized protein n=1 Tax=Dendrobium thyrsiflorum TaxID=117978 RepID=A0ABD0UHI1_DENTH